MAAQPLAVATVTENPVPEGWSTDSLADALKPERRRERPSRPAAPEATFPPAKLSPAAYKSSPEQEIHPASKSPPAQERPPEIEAPPPSLAPSATPAPPVEVAPASNKAANPQESQPDLLEATLSAPPAMSPAEDVPASRQPAHEILDSILRRKESGKPAAPAPAAGPAAETPIPDDSGKDPVAEAPHAPRTALAPQHMTDPHEAAKAAMLGMGEVLSRNRLMPMTSSSPEARPLLQVPFLPVNSAPGEERRAWMTHLKVMGIVCFVLVDVLLIFVYKERIAGWWSGADDATPAEHAPRSNEGPSHSAAPAIAQSPAGPSSEPSQDTSPASDSSTTPAVATPALVPSAIAVGQDPPPAVAALPPSLTSSPGQSVVPALSASGLTITAPSEFAQGSATLNPAFTPAESSPSAVPMAIPLPAHPEETVPPPSLLPPPPSEASPSAVEESPSSATPPIPPLPEATPSLPAVAGIDASSASTAVPSAPTTPLSEASAAGMSVVPPIPPEPPPPSEPAAVSTARIVGKVPAEANSALETLQKFLTARDWKERSAYVQKPDIVRPAMEKQAANGGDGPIIVGEIDFLERYPSKAGVPAYCMFEVSGGSLKHPVLTLVEQSPKDGVRVDWEAFVEFKDDLLLHFLEKKGSPPQKFRGLLRRKHYFDKDVPDIAGKDSFELAQPNAHFEGQVFVPRNSPLGKELANQLPWGQDMPVIAELVWKSDSKVWWVQIENIVSYGWRG